MQNGAFYLPTKNDAAEFSSRCALACDVILAIETQQRHFSFASRAMNESGRVGECLEIVNSPNSIYIPSATINIDNPNTFRKQIVQFVRRLR